MVANVAIIIAALLFSSVLVKSYLTQSDRKIGSTSPPVAQKVMQKGDVVNVPNMTWPQNGRTLLLALSTTCHFCTDSAQFYRRISKEHGDTHLIALVPQDTNEGEEYLAKLGVKVDEVREASFGELGITGTPTLVLLDMSGKVVNMWEGVLPPTKESEVLVKLMEKTARSQ
jgi:thioredoxin-related protein